MWFVAGVVLVVGAVLAFGLGFGVGRRTASRAPVTTEAAVPTTPTTEPFLPQLSAPTDPPTTERTTTDPPPPAPPTTTPRVGPPGAPVMAALAQTVAVGHLFTCPRWEGALVETKTGPGRTLPIRSMTLVRSPEGICMELDLGDGLLYCGDPYDDHALYLKFDNGYGLNLHCTSESRHSQSTHADNGERLDLRPKVGAVGAEGQLVSFVYTAPAPAPEMLTAAWTLDYV